MNKASLEFWGRKFSLNIIFECYSGEEILDHQRESLQNFLEKNHISDDDLKKIKKYCKKNNKDEIDGDIENIFKYVIPEDIYISREKGIIAIMCNYKFDLEHGIALIYKKNKLIGIEKQDYIL